MNLDEKQIETEYTNEVIRKTGDQHGWHDRLPTIIKKELTDHIDRWIGLGRIQNVSTKETRQLLEKYKKAIYLVTKRHLKNHDKNN